MLATHHILELQPPTPLLYCFETGSFFVALEVLELTRVDQTGLKLAEIHLPLPPEFWD